MPLVTHFTTNPLSNAFEAKQSLPLPSWRSIVVRSRTKNKSFKYIKLPNCWLDFDNGSHFFQSPAYLRIDPVTYYKFRQGLRNAHTGEHTGGVIFFMLPFFFCCFPILDSFFRCAFHRLPWMAFLIIAHKSRSVSVPNVPPNRWKSTPKFAAFHFKK